MVSVPVRGWETGFAPAVKFTDPLPDPLAPEVIVSHGVFDTAIQAQPEEVVTATELALAFPVGEKIDGLME
jgi:hypothetical protein